MNHEYHKYEKKRKFKENSWYEHVYEYDKVCIYQAVLTLYFWGPLRADDRPNKTLIC